MDASGGEAGDRVSISSWHSGIGILRISKESQALSPFEALNSAQLSRCQRDVRPTVQMRRRPRAFSKVITRDSDIPSSCEIKDETAFKSLHGNTTFFFSQGISVSTPLHAAKSESLSHTCC